MIDFLPDLDPIIVIGSVGISTAIARSLSSQGRLEPILDKVYIDLSAALLGFELLNSADARAGFSLGLGKVASFGYSPFRIALAVVLLLLAIDIAKREWTSKRAATTAKIGANALAVVAVITSVLTGSAANERRGGPAAHAALRSVCAESASNEPDRALQASLMLEALIVAELGAEGRDGSANQAAESPRQRRSRPYVGKRNRRRPSASGADLCRIVNLYEQVASFDGWANGR